MEIYLLGFALVLCGISTVASALVLAVRTKRLKDSTEHPNKGKTSKSESNDSERS